MAIIPAKRFTDLSTNFNVATIDFASVRDAVVLNAPEIDLSSIKDTAKSMLDQLKGVNQSFKEQMGEVDTVLKDATRLTQNLYDSFVDLSKLPEAKVGELINDIFPADMAQVSNALKGMTKVCRNNALGAALPFGKLAASQCDGMNIGTNKCTASGASVLGKALTGGLNSLITSVSNIVGKVMALANLGFNANLCKILGGLLEGVTSKGIVGTTLGLLSNQQGRKGNFNAILDISNNALQHGINVGKLIPATISNIVSGVTSFGENYQNGQATAFARFDGALESLDATRFLDDWGSDTPTVEKFEGATRIYTSGSRDTLANMDFDEEDLDTPISAQETTVAISTMYA